MNKVIARGAGNTSQRPYVAAAYVFPHPRAARLPRTGRTPEQAYRALASRVYVRGTR